MQTRMSSTCKEMVLCMYMVTCLIYSKTCLRRPLKKKAKIGFQYRLLLNAGQKYSAIFSTFIKLPWVIKIFFLSILEWQLKTGITVLLYYMYIIW